MARHAPCRQTLRLLACVAALGTIGLGTAAFTQSAWPTAKPITLIVPFSAGGSVDFTARLLAQKLSERLQQNVIVDNAVGAAGVIGMDKAVRAAPDAQSPRRKDSRVLTWSHGLACLPPSKRPPPSLTA